MRSIVGNPVSGDDFYGRADELRRLHRTIVNGNHVLIKAPRRVGKSSLLAELARLMQAEGWNVAEADVQDCDDEASFLQTLHEAVQNSGATIPADHKVGEFIRSFRNALRGAKLSAGRASITIPEHQEAGWEDAAGSLRSLMPRLARDAQHVLVVLDELPIFLSKLLTADDGPKRVRRILDWLRSVRQACGSDVPWILCGSIGLDSFVAKQGLEGTTNDLIAFELGAFSAADAKGLLQRLAEDEGEIERLPDVVIDAMIERIGWPIPYYVQLMFHELMNLPADRRNASFPSSGDVDAAFAAATRAHSLGHWVSRMHDLLDPDAQSRARTLLTALSSKPDGMTRDELLLLLSSHAPATNPDSLHDQLGELLRFLEDDGYLICHGAQWTFRSFLLRDHWQRRFVR